MERNYNIKKNMKRGTLKCLKIDEENLKICDLKPYIIKC